MKRAYYLLGIVGTIAIVVAAFFFLRYRAGTTTPAGTENTAQNVGLPPTPSQSNPQQNTQTPSLPGTSGGSTSGSQVQKFGLVSQNPVLNYFVDAQNNAVLVQPDGQIAKVTTGGPSVLSSSAIANLISAKFSYDGAKILATFGDIFAPQGSIFDVAGKSWQPLSLGVRSIAWSPNNYQIAYLNNKNNATILTTVDAANSNAKPVELLKLHAEDLELFWPATNNIILSDKTSSLARGSVWGFDVKQKTVAQIVSDGLGLESIWANTGSGLVFRAGAGGFGGSLSLIDAAGRAINYFSIFTFPSKCSFDIKPIPPIASSTNKTAAVSTSSNSNASGTAQNYLYCAIPRDGAKLRTAAMPDDYEMKKLFTSDDFYRIDLTNGNIYRVFSDPSRNLDATNLKRFGNYLFFVNRYDQKLYWVSL